MHHFDVVVIGGGVVGLTMALSLAQDQFKVAVFEQKKLNSSFSASTFDTRVFALNRTSVQILTNLGAWQAIEQLRVAPYQRMSVWDANGDGYVDFDSDHRLEGHLGVIVEQQALNSVLVQRCHDHLWCDLFEGISIHQIDVERGYLTLTSGDIVHAKVIIGADGSRSWLREQLGISVEQRAYQQRAIVATLKCEKSHANTAYQCFQSKGPVALLPLSESNVVSLVWSTHIEHVDALMALNEPDFCLEVTGATESVLGQMDCLTPRASFELNRQNASFYVMDRCALVGDAAHVIHPLAGQGMNLGLLDAATLRDALVDWRQQGEVCLARYLSWYQRQRKANVQFMMLAMDSFHHGFTSQKLSLITLRNLGFRWVNKSKWLKNQFIDFALGKNENNIPYLGKRRLNAS